LSTFISSFTQETHWNKMIRFPPPSRRSVLFIEETGKNHLPAASHWQTLSHNAVFSYSKSTVTQNLKSLNKIEIIHLYFYARDTFYFFFKYDSLMKVIKQKDQNT
jgi:hypothetical protein